MSNSKAGGSSQSSVRASIHYENTYLHEKSVGISIGVSFLFLFFAFNVNTLNKYYHALMHQGHRGKFIQDLKARVLPKKRNKQANNKMQKPSKETNPVKTSALERKISPSEKEETKYGIESRGPGKEMIKAFQFLDPLRSRKKQASPSDPELGGY